MKAVGDHVYQTNSLFWISPLTIILNFNFSRLPSDLILLYKHSYMESKACPSIYLELKKSDC